MTYGAFGRFSNMIRPQFMVPMRRRDVYVRNSGARAAYRLVFVIQSFVVAQKRSGTQDF
jgi:hypothetical protein